MNRRVLSIYTSICLLVCCLQAVAQNNPYAIDDRLYDKFQKVSANVNSDSFRQLNDDLRTSAIELGDRKAETISYYLETTKARSTGDEANMLKAVDECCAKAEETGYMQYYYSAVYNLSSFYFNRHTDIDYRKSIEITQAGYEKAKEDDDAFGQWNMLKLLANLNVAALDRLSGRKLLKQAVKIYETTDDPVLKSQSMCTTYIDLAKTYNPGSDSLKMYLDLAISKARTFTDTLRHAYQMSMYCAVKKDNDGYRHFKDIYYSGSRSSVFRNYGTAVFDITEAALNGNWDKANEIAIKNKDLDINYYLAFLADAYNRHELSKNLMYSRGNDLERAIESASLSRMNQIEAAMGSDRLKDELIEKSQKLNKAYLAILALVLLVLIILVAAFTYYRHRKEAMIAKLKEANARVVRADASKTAFVQNMSHEVRTPLNAIVGFSQLLGLPAEVVSDKEREEYSSYVLDNSNILTMLIDDILNASDIETGNYRIDKSMSPCNDIVRSAMKTVEYRVPPEVRLYYTTEVDDDYRVLTDPRRVQQILINFLTNACKHTEKGSIHVNLSLTENPDAITFSVADTGTGVPADQAENIFERFVKLDTFVQGTGLGLNICRTLSEKLGGKVALDTSYTDGARFTFVLPTEQM